MSWAKVDPNAPSHEKIMQAGLEAFGLYVAGLCYASRHLTDGFIPQHALVAVAPGAPPRRLLKLAVRLVEARLWVVRETGWEIHDYARYHPTKEEELAERAKRHDRNVAGGKARASAADRIAGRFVQPTTSQEAGPLAGVAGHQPNQPGTSDPAPASSRLVSKRQPPPTSPAVDKSGPPSEVACATGSDRPRQPSADEQLTALAHANGQTPEAMRAAALALASTTARGMSVAARRRRT